MAAESRKPFSNSYDEIPYHGHAFVETQPQFLAAIGRLHGLETPSAETARVLELGSGAGENSLPLAYLYPHAEFHCIDLSEQQIKSAEKKRRQLGLSNVHFLREDILNYTPSQPFDFIICHGVFSWVPPLVRERILSLIERSLQPNGVAFLSYNTNPAWKDKATMRNFLLFHTEAQKLSPKNAAGEIRKLVEFIDKHVERTGESHASLIKREKNLLEKSPDWYLLHEYLEDNNFSVYFHEFMDLLYANKLEYLSDARPHLDHQNFPRAGLAHLPESALEDRTERLQLLDFISNRAFRRSIICKSSAKPLQFRKDNLAGLYFSFPRDKRRNIEIGEGNTVAWNDSLGHRINSQHPLLAQVLKTLRDAYPRNLHCAELARALSLPARAEMLIDTLEFCFTAGLINIHSLPYKGAHGVSRTPKLLRPAFLKALNDAPKDGSILELTSTRHEVVQLSSSLSSVLRLLDGTRSIEELLQQIMTLSQRGIIKFNNYDSPANQQAAQFLSQLCQTLLRDGLLEER